ncbi:MAG: 3-deoxy-7-phosphoheptulonate synthase [Thermomicrobiales bacterium]
MLLVLMNAGVGPAEDAAISKLVSAAGCSASGFQSGGRRAYHVAGATPEGLTERLQGLPGVDAVLSEDDAAGLRTSNLRIASIRPLLPPAILMEELPLPPAGAALVHSTREQIRAILDGRDERLLVVVGPCSVHDPVAAIEYGRRLKEVADNLADDLCIVMRVYFEKPRTTVGWKGLINDPHIDESFRVNDGLRLARQLLLELGSMGVPAGCEFLDPVLPQFFADLVTWGAIGARTTESQTHRELASGLSMPVGFKNGTGGGLQMAVDAVGAAAHPHHFLGVTEQGLSGIVATRGNPDCHVILRGGKDGPNYDAASVETTLGLLRGAKLAERVMIDTSHGNSGKDYRRQPDVARSVAEQVTEGQRGIIGVLMESFLVDGAQKVVPGGDLVFGQSVTDSCMGWEMTLPVLETLAGSVRARRRLANDIAVSV